MPNYPTRTSQFSWIGKILANGSSQIGLLVILICFWIVFSISTTGFLSPFNLNSLGRSLSIDIVIGFSQMVVLATGGMNISVGAIGVCAVMAGGFMLQILGLPIPLAVFLTLCVGSLLGSFNGIVIVKTGVNSFIVTLATASLFSGGMLILSQSSSFNALPREIVSFGRQNWMGVSSLVWVALAIGALLIYFYHYTKFGRQILASGANPRAAKLSGVSVGNAIIFSHALSGALAAAAGLMLMTRLGAALPSVGGDDWLLPSFLAPILGGTAQAGGIISVIGCILGAALVSTIRNGLLVMQVGSFWFQFFLGVILLGAVLLERYRANRALKKQTSQA